MTTSTTDFILASQPKPGTRVKRTRQQWKTLLNKFDGSGLTRSAFCKQHQIATSGLYRWQKLFAEESGGAAEFIDVTEPLTNTVAPAPAPDNDWQVELELSGGIVLRLRTR